MTKASNNRQSKKKQNSTRKKQNSARKNDYKQSKSKTKANNSMKLFLTIIALIIAISTAILIKTGVINIGNDAAVTTAESDMVLHYIDVGQGDCTLITCGEDTMLIDAGDNDKGTAVQAYLNSQNISRLTYVIGSHPDADHYGGLDVVITKFDCENLILPDFKKDTRTCEDVYKAAEYKNVKITKPVVGNSYSFGSGEFTIVASGEGDYGNTANNHSIAVLITHGENSFLFTGDAEEEAEDDMVAGELLQPVSVYQVGHHGSTSSTSEAFLSAISPEYAVISCGVGNDYGHPHSQTLNRLRLTGVKVYRTDEQGTIICTSNGSDITWNCQPSDTWQSGR